MKKFNYLFWGTYVILFLVLGWFAVKAYTSPFENFQQKELLFNDLFKIYYYEDNGEVVEVLCFSKPDPADVDFSELRLYPGRNITCFQFCEKSWVYPTEMVNNNLLGRLRFDVSLDYLLLALLFACIFFMVYIGIITVCKKL